MDNLYFKKVNEKAAEDSFGADALLEKTTRNASIKTMDEPVWNSNFNDLFKYSFDGLDWSSITILVHFATLDKVAFENSLRKIEHKKLNRKIDFL